MAFQLQVSANKVAPGSCYPQTWAQALISIAQNLYITGLGALNSFNFGPTVPATDLQDRPWIRTDALYKFLGIFTYTQGAWKPADPVLLAGTILDIWAANPSTIVAPYYVANGQVITGTVNGTVTTPNLQGLVTIGAGTNASTGTVFNPQSTGGEETHKQTLAELAAHTHAPLTGTAFNVQGGGGAFNDNIAGGSPADATTGSTGGGTPFNVLQPYMALYKVIFWP